jgi:hypothetical protein
MLMRSALFWDITRRRVVNNDHTTPRNIPEELDNYLLFQKVTTYVFVSEQNNIRQVSSRHT